MRGPKGTTVALTVRRGEDDRRAEIARDVIQKHEVTSELLEGTVGYIRLGGFSETGADEVKDAIQATSTPGRRLILDLRGNPGGFVTAARSVASQFIAEGSIFWQEDARATRSRPTRRAAGSRRTPR